VERRRSEEAAKNYLFLSQSRVKPLFAVIGKKVTFKKVLEK